VSARPPDLAPDPNDDPLLGRRVGPFIDVGRADVAEHELRAIELEGRYLLVSRVAGELCALDDQCNHAGCLLSSGWVEPKKAAVVCPCHEYEFELASGRNVTVPRLCEDQEKFAVRVDEGRILVLLGGER
jgi:3-phenylpropionate/trans-cinnamate dioxygenase ferredoxin subunit